MKKLSFIIVLFAVVPIFAQTKYKLQGEGLKNNVKLIWSVDKWPEGLQGLVIKRRSIEKNGKKSAWAQLNKKALKIGNSKSKDLSNTTNSKELIEQLQKKRIKYLNNTKKGATRIEEVEENILQKELKDADAFTMLMLFFYYDFDVAMLYGFGYSDTKVPKAYMYEYGLFAIKDGKTQESPVASYKWKYGDKPDLSVKIKKEKIKKRKKTIQLYWVFDTEDYDKKANIAGFNIYRKTQGSKAEKLNPTAIWLNKANEKRTLFFKDTTIDTKQSYTYFITPVSIFKNEGVRHEIKYHPKDHEDITPPILSSNVNSGDDFINEGVQLKWEFRQKEESRIIGFVIERRIMPNVEYNIISDTINPSAREYADNELPGGKGQNFHYRVTALQDESYPLWSNVERLFYDPKPDLSKSKLTATPKIENENIFVELKWEGSEKNLKLSKGYGIFTDRAGGILAYEQDIEAIKGYNYNYAIEGATGTNYLFAIALIDNNEVATIVTDTVKVIIPTTNLPFISIWPISANKQKVTIDWKYKNNIPDLAGFRVYANDVLIADEQKISKDLRKWTTDDLDPGRYNFQIEAITSFGITSPRSKKVKITVKQEE